MYKFITSVALVLLISTGGFLGYRFAESKIAVDIYRDRLQALSAEYDTLADQYNDAVRKTAVTELIVKDGALTVVVRRADGQQSVIETPYDPSKEIHCDYVLLDGRLWIRRVYDDATPPREGVLIDPSLAHIDWDAPGARYGIAVYRSLDEGRWIVTATGNGSLGLVKVEGEYKTQLSPPPVVQGFEEIEKQINDQVDSIGFGEVLGRAFGNP
jgi:hypothetical protein